MIFFKILQKFLLPGAWLFILWLMATALILNAKTKKAGKLLFITAAAGYFLLSTSPVADLILWPLEKQYPPVNEMQTAQADYLVLFRGGGQTDVLRAAEALKLYNQKPELKIIISGADPLNPENRNPILTVKQFLTDRGVPAENIILEDQSRNTRENALYVENLIDNRPSLLVTSAYHLPRSLLAFKNQTGNLIPAPADFQINQSYNLFDFFPSPGNLVKVDLAVHEYLGIIWYKFLK